jgi:heme-degrading monooxygenase HmoA
MIGIIVHHYTRPGQEATARKLIQENGQAMRAFPGFGGRYTLIAQNNPRQISTLTLWETPQDRDRWMGSDARNQVRKQVADRWDQLWESTPEPELFDVVPEL